MIGNDSISFPTVTLVLTLSGTN